MVRLSAADASALLDIVHEGAGAEALGRRASYGYHSRRELRRLEYYAEVWRKHRIEDALRLWFPAPAGRARTLYLERSGKNYTERDKLLLTLLRPHLVSMQANAALRRRGGSLSLTRREAEVLGWIARGKTNAQISRLLFVSPHTVRKHVEHIFEKLGVHTRAAAVARWRAAPHAPAT